MLWPQCLWGHTQPSKLCILTAVFTVGVELGTAVLFYLSTWYKIVNTQCLTLHHRKSICKARKIDVLMWEVNSCGQAHKCRGLQLAGRVMQREATN